MNYINSGTCMFAFVRGFFSRVVFSASHGHGTNPGFFARFTSGGKETCFVFASLFSPAEVLVAISVAGGFSFSLSSFPFDYLTTTFPRI